MKAFFKSHTTKYLLVFSVFAVILVLFREMVLQNNRFLFLIKNLLLAWIPYLFSAYFLRNKINNYGLILCAGFWLLFFPNALYLTTDFFHLWPKPSASVWYDLIMIFSFAICGLFLGFGSLRNFELLIASKFNYKIGRLSVVMFLFLGSFGVYIGRFMRFNSWDIITAPVYFHKEGLFFFESPFDDVDLYIAPVVFTIFCYLLYYGIFHFGKNHQ
ncbi:MAG: DUF1361 domain-containing protein [Vicingaceae bacterium]